MSVARVHYVKKAAKDQGKCEKCGDALPVGSAYRWYSVGFRSHYKHRRCMKHTCTPRTSELESSLLSSVYAAQEDAEGALGGDPEEDTSSLSDALSSVAEAAREVAEQYRTQDESFGGGGATESAERADSLEEYADNLESWSAPESDRPTVGCDKHGDEQQEGCEACEYVVTEWWEDQAADARSAMEDLSL
jgi:hypothetical protein